MALAGASGGRQSARPHGGVQLEAPGQRREGEVGDQAAAERFARCEVEGDVTAIVDEGAGQAAAGGHRCQDVLGDCAGYRGHRRDERVGEWQAGVVHRARHGTVGWQRWQWHAEQRKFGAERGQDAGERA